MKYISIIEPASTEAIKAFAEKRNLSEYLDENYQHPQEDYLFISDSIPVFVVADGVTLNFKKILENKQKYPNPSPAGEVAKIFCEAVEKSTKTRYENLNKSDIENIFIEANNAVANYNNKVGQSDISGNPTSFYSATGSFVVIKDNIAYWSSICDAFFAHFDNNMKIKFMSSGVCTPYAVINGEERMVNYIEKGTANLESGDRIFVFTDGFESYIKNSNFTDLFKEWNGDLDHKIKSFFRRMNVEDPEKYGHERSLISILI